MHTLKSEAEGLAEGRPTEPGQQHRARLQVPRLQGLPQRGPRVCGLAVAVPRDPCGDLPVVARAYQAGQVQGAVPCGAMVTYRGPYQLRPPL
jgi:hypothetical protein